MTVREEIEAMLERGLSVSEIARQAEVARSTVEYHLERLTLVPAPQEAPDAAPLRSDVVTHVPTRQLVVERLERGFSRAAIARELGLSKATVSYHARRAGLPVDSRCARRYDWAAIQEYYDLGHSLSECVGRFGFSRETWHEAVKRGAIVPRPTRLPSEELFARGVYRSRMHLKRRLIEEGHKRAACEICGLTEWLGHPLSVVLHHLNGDRNDNRIENLQLLCPNCHSQTDSFSGRNGHRRRNISTREASLN